MFPEGLSRHGAAYFLNSKGLLNVNKSILDTNISEIIFEYVRRSDYSDKPSRFQSIFATDSLENAQKFKEKFRSSHNTQIWQVEADQYFRGDMTWLKTGHSSVACSSNAHSYWKGEENQEPFWEFVLPLPVKIVKQVG